MHNRFNFLRDIYFLRGASDDDVDLLATLCHESAHPAGEVLFREGERADRFFIIVEGEVEVWRDFGKEGAELLAIHGKGRFFGEMALIDDLPRSATTVVRGGAKLLWMARDEFQALVRTRTSIAYGILVSISGMVRASNDSYVQDLRKQNEALAEANRELKEAQASLLRNERLSTLGKFSSMILHDIRNPVSVLRGQLQLLSMHAGDAAKAKKYLDNAFAELDRIERLASEFLDYTRGDIRLNYSIANPRALFEKVRQGLAERFTKADIRISIDADPDSQVLLDSDRILRVLFNLADNARKAMPKGGTFSLRAHHDDGYLELEVSDSGEGMDEDTLSRIFEPFYSASTGGGTGLGMLIVKNIVEAHGGAIMVRSEVGKGTAISIRLPART
jgi:signal transduction histidine kinase